MDMKSFTHYLQVKKTVDDRALNLRVWNQLKRSLHEFDLSRPLRVLEIGGGIGTMLTRMLDDALLPNCEYTLLDMSRENIQEAPKYLQTWATNHDVSMLETESKTFAIKTPKCNIQLKLVHADVFDFLAMRNTSWDLLIGHAVLDLFDLETALPILKKAISPGGLLYFTINYDGHTIFEPQVKPDFEAKLLHLYNQSMDDRLTDGKISGDSKTGRHIFTQLKRLDVDILAAGSSDWIVYAGPNGYPHNEKDFLHHLITMIENEMNGHPEIDLSALDSWVSIRKDQIASGDLVCIVHQMDFLGKVSDN